MEGDLRKVHLRQRQYEREQYQLEDEERPFPAAHGDTQNLPSFPEGYSNLLIRVNSDGAILSRRCQSP